MSLEERSNISRTLATAFRIGPSGGVAGFRSLYFQNGPLTSHLRTDSSGTFRFDSGVTNSVSVEFREPSSNYGFSFQANDSQAIIQSLRNPLEIRTPNNATIISINGQENVRIGGSGTEEGSALAALYFGNTNKGFLPPRLTTAQRNALTAVTTTAGLMVYDTDLKMNMQSDGLSWKEA